MSRLNVARMRRHMDRDRERYFWKTAGRRGVTRDGVFRPGLADRRSVEDILREQEEKLDRTCAQILANPDNHHPVTVEWATRRREL